jgi:hypothetical protein
MSEGLSIGQMLALLRDEHRKDFNDVQWMSRQRIGPPSYEVGDVVSFRAGGVGVIVEKREGTHLPPSYTTGPIEGFPYHPKSINAWHYEGDFTLLKESPIRETKRKKQEEDERPSVSSDDSIEHKKSAVKTNEELQAQDR